MKKIYLTSISAVMMAAVPMVTFAAIKTLQDVGRFILYLLDWALVLIMAFAVVAFVWFTVKYFIIDSDSANKKDAGMYVLYSLLAFFIILSFWGLVNILQNTFGLGNNSNRPSSWSDITNIFPASGYSGGSGPINQSPSGGGIGTGGNNSGSATGGSNSGSATGGSNSGSATGGDNSGSASGGNDSVWTD